MAGALIQVPNAAVVRMGPHTMSNADWSVGDHSAVVEFHPAWCHMEPWIVAALAAWGRAHRAAGGSITVRNPDRARYAWRMGLGPFLGYDPPQIQEREEAGRFIALRSVRDNAGLQELLPAIVTLLHVTDKAAEAVVYAFSELVRNVLEHSESADGALVCAQRFGGKTKTPRVSIGVADTGVGLRGSLAKAHTVANDRDAVLMAMKPGVTGAVPSMYGTSNNAGAGLFVTRNLSTETLGYFSLASGDAMFVSSLATRKPSESSLVRQIPSYPGTVVCAEVGLRPGYDYAGILADSWEILGRGGLPVRRENVRERIQFL